MTAHKVIKADLHNTDHQRAVLSLLDAYSADPMGDGKPLSDYARANLIEGLKRHPTALVFLLLYDGQPRGLATCFLGFSTFAARTLINIHDIYVDKNLRGRGLGNALLSAIEQEAKTLGCCKLTLEVQQNNDRARNIYEQFGFAQVVYPADQNGGGSLYMSKPLG